MVVGMSFGGYGGLFGKAYECRSLNHGYLSGFHTLDDLHALSVAVTQCHRAFLKAVGS